MFAADPALCYIDFSLNPIPADAFGPGSDPFTGLVPLQGLALSDLPECPSVVLSGTDAVLERLDPIDLPIVGSSHDIRVEMLHLQLVSAAPITVTFGGSKRAQQFDLHVRPAPAQDSWIWTSARTFENITMEQSPAMAGLEHYFRVWYSPPEEDPLEVIVEEIALSMPLLIVKKGQGHGKRATNCAQNFCMNEFQPLVFLGTGIQITLDGVCTGPPVSFHDVSWGMVKSGY
jgi:hypothetical protein